MLKDTSLFRLKNNHEATRIIKDIRNLFEKENEDYYKPVRVGNFCGRIYIKCDSNGDTKKTLSIKEYVDEIKAYLKYIINNLQKFDSLKILLTIAINFVSSKDNGEEPVMHSKSNNKEITSHDKAGEVIKDFFESTLFRYQIGLETSMKGINFIFDLPLLTL